MLLVRNILLVRMKSYKPLATFSLKCSEIRMHSIRKLLWIGETSKALVILHHTLMDLETADMFDYTEKEQSELITLFGKVAISVLNREFSDADYDLRDIDYYLHAGETETKQRLLDSNDMMADLGLLQMLPMDLRREIGSKLI